MNSTDVRESQAPTTEYFVKLPVSFREKYLRELRGAPLSVFLCLGLHVNSDSITWVSHKTICEETGYSLCVVKKTLATLEEKGYIQVRSNGDFHSNTYKVNHGCSFGSSAAAPNHDLKNESHTPKAPLVPTTATTTAPTTATTKATFSPTTATPKATFSPSTKATFSPRKEKHIKEKGDDRPRGLKSAGDAPRKTQERKRSEGDPRVKQILDEIAARCGYPIPNYGKESKPVKKALVQGYTPEEILELWEHKRQDRKWQGRWLPLAYVCEDLGAWKNNPPEPEEW